MKAEVLDVGLDGTLETFLNSSVIFSICMAQKQILHGEAWEDCFFPLFGVQLTAAATHQTLWISKQLCLEQGSTNFFSKGL